jgi:hypothetical protein
LLPVATVAGEAGDLAGGDSADPPEADLGDHALKTGADDAAGGRAAEVVVHDLNLGPTQLPQAGLHGVLQLLAFEVVSGLESRGLSDVEDSTALKMVGVDFIAHERLPRASGRRGVGRGRHEASGPGVGLPGVGLSREEPPRSAEPAGVVSDKGDRAEPAGWVSSASPLLGAKGC